MLAHVAFFWCVLINDNFHFESQVPACKMQDFTETKHQNVLELHVPVNEYYKKAFIFYEQRRYSGPVSGLITGATS